MSLSIYEDGNPKSSGVDGNKTLGSVTCLSERYRHITDSERHTLMDFLES